MENIIARRERERERERERSGLQCLPSLQIPVILLISSFSMIGLPIVFMLGQFQKDKKQLVSPREHKEIGNLE